MNFSLKKFCALSTRSPSPARLKPVELVLCAGILIVLAGLVVPVLRSRKIQDDVVRARHQLREVRDAMRALLDDTAVAMPAAARAPDADRFHPHRLCGPGRVAPGSYFAPDDLQGSLESHLRHGQPLWPAAPSSSPRPAPYLESLRADPWGQAFVVVLYPLFLDDERDCIVVCAGPNGRMDASYASPFDVQAAGDDLLEVIHDKSAAESAPLF